MIHIFFIHMYSVLESTGDPVTGTLPLHVIDFVTFTLLHILVYVTAFHIFTLCIKTVGREELSQKNFVGNTGNVLELHEGPKSISTLRLLQIEILFFIVGRVGLCMIFKKKIIFKRCIFTIQGRDF